MNIQVWSRFQMESICILDTPYVIISARDVPRPEEITGDNPNCRAILRLAFADIEADRADAFQPFHAQSIWDFICLHKPETVICQCEAGQSRSAGIAAALACIFNGDDSPFFRGGFTPNSRVRRMVLRAAGHWFQEPPLVLDGPTPD